MVNKLTRENQKKNQNLYTYLIKRNCKSVNVLTFLMAENNITAKKIAENLGVSKSYVSMVYSGKRKSEKVWDETFRILGIQKPWP